MAEAMAIVQMVEACIALTKLIIDIGQAAKNAQGLPKKLAGLFDQVPLLKGLFEKAKENSSKLDASSRKDAEPVLQKCEDALDKLHGLFKDICPKDQDNWGKRIYKGTKATIFGKNSKLQGLWKEIKEYMETLEQQQIFQIGDRLSGLEDAMMALAEEEEAGGKYTYNGVGDMFVTEGDNHKSMYQGAKFNASAGGRMYFGQGDHITNINSNVSDPDEQCLQSLAFRNMRQRSDITAKARGTCGWIFKQSEYTNWVKRGGLLWIKGRPGTGKSTLMESILSKAVNQFQNSVLHMSFFFHRRGEAMQGSKLGFYRSLMHQMLSYDRNLLSAFTRDTQFRSSDAPRDWTESELEPKLVEYAVQLAKKNTLCVYVDALDEAEARSAMDILTFLRDLCPRESPSLRVCLSCRPWPDIIADAHWDYRIIVEEQNADDIDTYLELRFKDYMGDPDNVDLKVVKQAIAARAKGVFQWAVLVTNRVIPFRGLGKIHMLEMIEKTPEELSKVYQRMLDEFTKSASRLLRSQALRILRCITFAARPLSLVELRYAVSLDAEAEDVHLKSIRECESSAHWCASDSDMLVRVLQVSSGLVRTVLTRGKVGTLQFDHESVRDYMESQGVAFLESDGRNEPQVDLPGRAHRRLVVSCLRYIEAADQDSGQSSAFDDSINRIRRLPFAMYAINHCEQHMQAAEAHGASLSKLIRFTEWPSNRILATLRNLKLNVSDYPHDILDQTRNTLQHCAAQWGLYSLMEAIIPLCNERSLLSGLYITLRDTWKASEERSDPRFDKDSINVDDCLLRSPLSLSAERGHLKIVELLISAKQVVVGSTCCKGITELQYAARSGHQAIVELLLATRQFSSMQKNEALCSAAAAGHEPVVKLLMTTGKVKTSEDSLQAAARGNHWHIVKLFLDAGETRYGDQMEYYAARARQWDLLNLVLDKRRKGNLASNVLMGAAEGGDPEIVRLLIDRGARLDPRALRAAAKGGHQEAVELLLKANADINYRPPGYLATNPLQEAAKRGHVEVVQKLLAWGADVEAVSVDQKSALHLAAERGHLEVLSLLLAANVYVNRPCDFMSELNRGTALHAAVRHGHLEIVDALIAKGAVMDLENTSHKHALHLATEIGRLDIIKSLVRARSDLNAGDHFGETAMHYAARLGRLDVMETLVLAGADVCKQSYRGQTSLHVAQEARQKHQIYDQQHCAAVIEYLEMHERACARCLSGTRSIRDYMQSGRGYEMNESGVVHDQFELIDRLTG